MAGLNLHIYPSRFSHETRILKETSSLAASGLFEKILIAGIREDNLPEHEQLDAMRIVWRVPLKKHDLGPALFRKTMRLREWRAKILQRVRNEHVVCVNCHSLSSLSLGVALKKIFGCFLVYDTHELETETSNMRGIRKILAKAAESRWIRHVDRIVVVSPSIGKWYRERYGIERVSVVRNIPSQSSTKAQSQRPLLRDVLGISQNTQVLLYQGLLTPSRGVQILAEAFSRAPQNRRLVFLGNGPLEAEVKNWAIRCPEIQHHPAVAPQRVLEFTGGADIGFCLFEDNCLNYRYALPNKLFEYVCSGIPVVASNLPEFRAFMNEHECGWCIEPRVEEVAEFLLRLRPEEIQKKKLAAITAAKHLSWEGEMRGLLPVYEAQFGAKAGASR